MKCSKNKFELNSLLSILFTNFKKKRLIQHNIDKTIFIDIIWSEFWYSVIFKWKYVKKKLLINMNRYER